MKQIAIIFCAFFVIGMIGSSASFAAKNDFPRKPIMINCVYGPGGAADLALRLVAEHAGKNGISVNVVNLPAGGGTVAALETLKAKPDGHTVMFGSTSLITLPLIKRVGFTLDDFRPVANISDMPLTFCVLTSSGIKTFQEWMDKAKAEPGKYSYGSPAPISSQRLVMTTLVKEKFPGVQIQHVPYASGHEVNTALLGDHIKAAFGVPGTNRNYLKSGEFTLLAVTSPKRLAEYPNVPTFAEMYGDRYIWSAFHGLFVPKKTPNEVVEKLDGIVRAALSDPEVLAKFDKIGTSADYRNSRDFTESINNLRKFIEEAVKGLKL
jgi:tripartite-type tricarboxylate transporter receptor subunit TctC